MRNMSGSSLFLVLFTCGGMLLCAHRPLQAEDAEPAEDLREVSAEVSELARPVFDPNLFKEETKKADPFFEKLHKKRDAFFEKQRKERSAFLQKIRNRDLREEKEQKKIARFHKKQQERLLKFNQKMQKKISKHEEKTKG